jgi:cytochrome c biogenesis protein CcdA
MGQRIPHGSIYMINLLDQKYPDEIAESARARIWKVFIAFRSASAGILAVFIIARLVKLIIDTIIHGYALHSFYGCGIHLLAAIWSSVTHLFLHPARSIETGLANQPEEQQPAKTFPTT